MRIEVSRRGRGPRWRTRRWRGRSPCGGRAGAGRSPWPGCVWGCGGRWGHRPCGAGGWPRCWTLSGHTQYMPILGHGAIFQWIFQYYLVSFRPQRAQNTVQTTIAFADHQNIICMNYELQFVLLYPCSSHNTWACASRQIWNMTLYNKMLDHDNSWPQFLVVQFQWNLEPAAVPGTGPLHLLSPLPHLRLHFIILNNANRRYLILGQFI